MGGLSGEAMLHHQEGFCGGPFRRKSPKISSERTSYLDERQQSLFPNPSHGLEKPTVDLTPLASLAPWRFTNQTQGRRT